MEYYETFWTIHIQKPNIQKFMRIIELFLNILQYEIVPLILALFGDLE